MDCLPMGNTLSSEWQVISSTGDTARCSCCCGCCCVAALGVAELAKPGGYVPDSKSGMGIEDGIDVPTLASNKGDKRLVTGLPPSPNVLSSLLESSP